MTENQKLRKELQAAIVLFGHKCHDDCTKLTWLERAEQALALPTADHIPDAGEMVADHLPEAGKVIETAAPVGERAKFDAWKKTMQDGFNEWDAWQAALSAGDAGWQPIETAPKDGSDCWLLVEEEVRRGFWVEIEFEERRDLDGRYIDQTDDDAYWMDKDSGDSLEPTMFYPITKPLPPAPAMRKGQL